MRIFLPFLKREIRCILSKYIIFYFVAVAKDHCGTQGILPVAAN